jgi:tRNA 5-methylaminomethyl-2-thiouridine biosynthesis bifunctional protein
MSPTDPPDDESPLVWSEAGQPRSRLYGDIYFSTEDGLAESRAVFLQGCDLPGAWQGRTCFTVAELGFGTGLNILALLDLWQQHRPDGGQLTIFSTEAHPLAREEARRALAVWPQLAPLAGQLLSQWPKPSRGFHRLDFPDLGVRMDLAIMEVADALEAWSGQADAWFLDGFSPALNPQMWRDEVLALVGARSAPGARAATFTVAGGVRRGLEAAGFEVARQPGFGRKRQRLEASRAGKASDPAPPTVAIIGAGIAGASAARALSALGIEPLLFENGVGGSGNPAALVTPRIDASLGPIARLFAQALERATKLYGEIPHAVISTGVRQLAQGPKDAQRFEGLAGSDLFAPGALVAAGDHLDMTTSQVIRPYRVLEAWCPASRPERVKRLEPRHGSWILHHETSQTRVDRVILASAMGTSELVRDLPLRGVRGQASWASSDQSVEALAWGGYLIPTGEGFLFGATHDRDDPGTEVRVEDHARNLATLAERRPDLASGQVPDGLAGRAAIRATTPDHLPLAGPAGPDLVGLYLLTGMGSRGFALAPLLGDHLAALVLDQASPLPRDLAELVDPDRFRQRALRRGQAYDGPSLVTEQPQA